MENQQQIKETKFKINLECEITLNEEGYSIKHEPDLRSDMAGVLIAQAFQQKMLSEYEEMRRIGIPKELKSDINNRIKSLTRSIRELNETFNLILVKLLQQAESVKEEKSK